MPVQELSPVCRYVSERTGSSLSKQQLARLEEAIGLRRGDREEPVYLEYLKSMRGAAELAELMSVISVHKTDLFRDELQLEGVRATVLPRLVAERPVLRVWSAGCATGEEVATLLILIEEAGAESTSTVLGTDISSEALKTAAPLAFAPEVMKRVPARTRERYFREEKGRFELSRKLAMRAEWQRHNLMDQPYPLPPGGGGFDLIVCRNVLIYFTESAWERVVAGLIDRLRPGGVLVLGAAEPILGKSGQLEVLRTAQAFFYRRLRGDELKPTPPPPRPSAPLPAPSRPPPPARALTPPPDRPHDEGIALFEQVLERAAAGESDELTESGVRQALYLMPELAPARYVLAMLLEQRGANAVASSEYRRALATLDEGRAPATPFFLNAERLKTACRQAIDRLGYAVSAR